MSTLVLLFPCACHNAQVAVLPVGNEEVHFPPSSKPKAREWNIEMELKNLKCFFFVVLEVEPKSLYVC